jgi:hypothetical protein
VTRGSWVARFAGEQAYEHRIPSVQSRSAPPRLDANSVDRPRRAGLGRRHSFARAHSHRGDFRPERLRQADGPRHIRRGAGGARATCRPGAGAGIHRRERGVFRRPRHRLWADDALRRTADDRLRDRRDVDLAPLLGVSGRGATPPDGAVCQERGDHRRLLISLRHRRRPLPPGSLVAPQQTGRATRSCRRAA